LTITLPLQPQEEAKLIAVAQASAIGPATGEKKWDYRLSANSTVLFSGRRDGAFYALDARTGTEVWKTSLGSSVASGPMSYAVNGEQFVSVVSGNSLFTFALRR
jgi:alcohol dehydrogenase (cytochrome c)